VALVVPSSLQRRVVAARWEQFPTVQHGCSCDNDACYWLYYKGRGAGLTPGQTKMGLAIADNPLGPYHKHEENPVLDSGHEVCVWPQADGVAALVAPCGPQGSTLQYSSDGVRFEKCADIVPPSAPGPFRADGFRDDVPGPGITWGLCQDCSRDRPFLARFECDLGVFLPGT